MKGSIADLIFISLSFIILFIFIGVVFYANNIFFKNVLPILNTTKVNEISPKVESFSNTIFNIIPYAWILLSIGALVSAFLISAHPIFLVAGICFASINVIISYFFQQIIIDFLPFLPELMTYVVDNFILSLIIGNFPIVVALESD